ncbi:MAG: hypothetical protein ACXWRU_19585 [Pseudobdellovibrionaceae bacterium]
MTVHRSDAHAKQVDLWVSRNAKDLSAKERPHLYAKAIQAIERRSLNTLSSVTVLVIVDRAIHETKENFPLLTQVKSEAEGIDFSALFDKPDTNYEELECALRALLIELLSVLGNITADVLTVPLHKELMDVTIEPLHTMNSVKKKNREQK